jgi:hypothetical protein
MENNLQNNKDVIFYYLDNNGNKIWTPSRDLAITRATVHNSEVFFVEYEVNTEGNI